MSGTLHHSDKVHSAISSGMAANSALVASWRRSARLYRLDPANRRSPHRLGEVELSVARDAMGAIVRVAQPSLDRLHHAVGGMGCCVLLANRDGVPIERRGHVGDDRTFEEWGLWPGTVWNEEAEGTNGIGTCLAEQRTLTVHRDQHFFSRNTLLSCSTAPIFDHEGRLVAALDVSSCRNDLTEELAGLVAMAVSDAARRIEAENFRLAFSRSRIVIAPVSDAQPSCLLALDKAGIVVGATRSARKAYLRGQDIIGKPLAWHEDHSSDVRFSDELRDAERAILERALIRHSGNVTAAARELGVSRATLHRKFSRLGLGRSQ